MKVLLLLFLAGCATAFVIQNKLENAAEQEEFLLELERAEAEAKTELGKKLQKMVDALLEKIKEEVEKGKAVREELFQKLKEVKEKLKELKMDIGHRARELIERIKKVSFDFWNKISGKEETHDVQAADFNLREMFKKLKERLLEKIDKEQLKSKIEEIFGKGSEMADSLLDLINKKGDGYKQKLLDLVDRYLGKDKRSIREQWEKMKDYFKNLNIELREQYMKFGEWVKENIKKGIENGKNKTENLKTIAKKFIDDAKYISKDVAEQAKEFFREYKEDLGTIYKDVREKIHEILNRN